MSKNLVSNGSPVLPEEKEMFGVRKKPKVTPETTSPLLFNDCQRKCYRRHHINQVLLFFIKTLTTAVCEKVQESRETKTTEDANF